jgi:hypothetical protein
MGIGREWQGEKKTNSGILSVCLSRGRSGFNNGILFYFYTLWRTVRKDV